MGGGAGMLVLVRKDHARELLKSYVSKETRQY